MEQLLFPIIAYIMITKEPNWNQQQESCVAYSKEHLKMTSQQAMELKGDKTTNMKVNGRIMKWMVVE